MRLLETIEDEKKVKRVLLECEKYKRLASGGILYRGVRNSNNFYFKVFKSRVDRKPKDTPQWAHDIIDSVFKEQFGWKVRSEGIFATGSRMEARSYGQVYIFIPIGDFKFVWSEKIPDMYTYLNKEEHFLYIEWKFKEIINRLTKEYTSSESSLSTAIKARFEIMFKCNEYLLAHETLQPIIEEWLNS